MQLQRSGFRLAVLVVVTAVATLASVAGAARAEDTPPIAPEAVLASTGEDTVRTNLMVAEAMLGDALAEVTAELPPGPVAVLLVPGSTEPAANLLTTVATHHLLAAGHRVHVDVIPPGTEGPVYELRYRVDDLALTYPDSGRRFVFWDSWVDRSMDLAVQFTLVDHADNQVVASRRVVRRFQDRVEAEQLAAVETRSYPFTMASVEGGGWSRRLEEIVVLGTLAGMVAIYFANTE
ncbi:hypothetical protein GF314_11035 [bacterium]|nr:hypothetical protein [bacterium]